jgi:hypothetical protein
MRKALGVATAAIVPAIVFCSAQAASGARACTAGVHQYGGANARTFCGSATATVLVGGKTVRFSGGECERGPAYLSINIGTVVLGTTSKPKPEYFGLLVGKAPIVGGTPAAHDGTFKPQALTFDHAGKGYPVLQSSVTLTNGRTRGTFTGTVLGSNARVRGSFRC